jgi:hypothetical protein
MGFKPNEAPSHMETINEFWDQMASTLEEAKLALAKAKNDMAEYYNVRTDPMHLQVHSLMLFPSALNHLTHVIWFPVPETIVSIVFIVLIVF